MRSGGCAVQQALVPDAAAVMRQAVSLARRRGHAQVTPLHVASAMLAPDAAATGGGGGILRAACLRSRAASHPLQCKALELCFNVALNRLATAGGGGQHPPPPPFVFHQFHPHHHHDRAPALSNALAAAFKRAQANQRRGGGGCAPAAEGQQQQLAARVELEQLVISILDDPSVNRVMREAGFSSAEVKAHVEKAVSSSEQSSANTAGSSSASPSNPTKPPSKEPSSKPPKTTTVVDVAGDAARVMDRMASGRSRSVVVVGDAAEAVVKAVMDRVSKGDLALRHECLRNLQFVPFSAASFQRLPREEVQARAGDMRALVREGCAAGKGVAFVLEDLDYAAEAWAAASWKRSDGRHYYCPVEHAVMELSSLVRGGGGGGGGRDKFWLLGFGAHASYTSCRSGQPSLEAVLDLHPVVVPDAGNALSLGGGESELTHCGGADMAVMATTASVPSWIRRGQGPVLSGSELTLSFSSPPASSSIHGLPQYDAAFRCEPWHDLLDRRQPPSLNHQHEGAMAVESCDQQLLANPNLGSSGSVSKSSSLDGATEPAAAAPPRRRPKFTELTAENLKVMCSALEARVPRHRDIAPGIASAVLQRRSGVTRTARPSPTTWLLFQGGDSDGKTAMARELARLVFGSYAAFTRITASKLIPTLPGGELSLKRPRSSPENDHHGYMLQSFYEAIREHPHRVVLIDGGEHDTETAGIIKNCMATGTVMGCNGDAVSLEDAIVVVSCEAFESRSRVSSPRRVKQRVMGDVVDGNVEDDGAENGRAVPRLSLDLNACATDEEGEEGSSPNDMMEILIKAADGVFLFQD